MATERAIVLAMIVANALVLLAIERRTRTGVVRRHRHTNVALTGLLLVSNVLLDRLTADWTRPSADPAGRFLHRAGLAPWMEVVLTVLVLDGLAYAAHVLMHELPLAWRFHRVHHSDADVNVTTAFRQHPFETVWRYSFLLAGVVALGASGRAVAVYLALSALNAQLEHADIALPWRADRLMRAVFASPAMHRVHHSRNQEETDSNYSNIFSFWDRIARTYRVPRAGERIRCGLDEHDGPRSQRTVRLLLLPFGR